MDGGGRRKRRSRGRETECFHLAANPVRLPPPDGTHRPPSPTPPPAASAASSECGRVKACITGRQKERGDSRLSVCARPCEMSQQWMSLRQHPPHLQPLLLPSPFTFAALPRARGGTSRVQRARRPPARRRQLVEAAASRAAIGHRQDEAECKLSNQFEEEKEKGKRKKKPCKKYKPSLSCWGFLETRSLALKTIHYTDGGVQKYAAVVTNSFS